MPTTSPAQDSLQALIQCMQGINFAAWTGLFLRLLWGIYTANRIAKAAGCLDQWPLEVRREEQNQLLQGFTPAEQDALHQTLTQM